jgi:hypothetical protein
MQNASGILETQETRTFRNPPLRTWLSSAWFDIPAFLRLKDFPVPSLISGSTGCLAQEPSAPCNGVFHRSIVRISNLRSQQVKKGRFPSSINAEVSALGNKR